MLLLVIVVGPIVWALIRGRTRRQVDEDKLGSTAYYGLIKDQETRWRGP